MHSFGFFFSTQVHTRSPEETPRKNNHTRPFVQTHHIYFDIFMHIGEEVCSHFHNKRNHVAEKTNPEIVSLDSTRPLLPAGTFKSIRMATVPKTFFIAIFWLTILRKSLVSGVLCAPKRSFCVRDPRILAVCFQVCFVDACVGYIAQRLWKDVKLETGHVPVIDVPSSGHMQKRTQVQPTSDQSRTGDRDRKKWIFARSLLRSTLC